MTAAPVDPGSFATTYLASVAEVLQTSDRIGLGFFVAPRILATCAHVVHAAGADLRVRIAGAVRNVRVVFEDEARDVAFLELDTLAGGIVAQPLDLDEGAHQGASVQFVGWTRDQDDPLLHTSRIEGVLSAELPPTGARRDVYQLAGKSRPGYSGGPAVLEGSRRLIGMVDGQDREQDVGLLVPGATIAACYRKLVARTGNEGAVAATTPGPRTGPRPPAPPPPGGRYRPEHHVPQPEVDRKVLELFDTGEAIVLCAPTMSGKTWWLNHFLPSFEERLADRGRVVTMAPFGKSESLKSILLSLITALLRGIRGDAKGACDTWDDELVPSEAATSCLEEHFFNAGDHEALLMLDVTDAFWDNPCQQAFFALFRFWSQKGGPWERLRLLVAYSTAPSLWLSDPADSPFGVLPVVIKDWSPAEVEHSAWMHGLDSDAESVSRLMSHTGGHPYFVRSVLHDARASQQSLEDAVARLGADPGPLHAPLERMFQRSGIHRDEQLKATLLAVADGRLGAKLSDKHYRRLADAGLIVGTARRPALRAPIAARVLRGE